MSDLANPAALLAEAQQREELARLPVVEQLAVLGPFSPALVPELAGPGTGDTAESPVVQLLCQQLPSGDAVLADRPRIEALTRILERGGRSELARVRRSVRASTNGPLQRMLDAFVLGHGPPVEERTEDELVASLEVWRWATEAAARARQTGGVHIEPGRDAIESRLALLDVTRAVRRLAAAGCVGREPELARLHEYRRPRPAPAPLWDDPPLVLFGIGGVGKSTLVARFVMDLYERQSPDAGVWAYLDLDRPTVASGEPAVILTDIMRQVAAQRVDQRRRLARTADVKRRRQKGAGLEGMDTALSWQELATELVGEMRRIADGALVVVLDTFEQLEVLDKAHPRTDGPTRARELRDLFAMLAAELPGFRLIVSGRAPAEVFLDPDRPDRRLHLRALEGDTAVTLVRHLVTAEAARLGRPPVEVDDDLAREVVSMVGGIPLTVRLAARVLAHDGVEAITDASTRARTLDHLRSEFVRGFLYQRVLGHINARPPVQTEDLRRLARASMVLRHLTVELVERVLVPALSPPPASTATDLFGQLSTEVALAETADGMLRVREELRVPALAALRLEDAALVRTVHERAVEFYGGQHDDAAAVELAYHRLALGASPASIDDQTLHRLDLTADDLPPSTAARLGVRVREPAAAAADRDLETWEGHVLQVADAALREGRLAEARRLLDQRPDRTPGTVLHRVASRLAQAEHDLTGATTAARMDLEAARAAADAPRFAAAAVRLAGLHEMQGAAAAAEDSLRLAGEDDLLAGHPLLRLELLLNRINLRERTGLTDGHAQWLLGLEARSLMQRSPTRELASSTALARLLAAAFGREEPARLREAVRRVGMGHEDDLVRVGQLAEAFAVWDMSLDPPGVLARGSGLRLESESPDAVRRAWSVLAGLGTDAGTLIDRVWSQATPPLEVRERLREIYLWWAVVPAVAAHVRPSEAGHLEHDAPLDWSKPQVLRLEELLITAYPTSTELLSVASQAGLDLESMSWASSTRRITREMLGLASREGSLEALLVAVLTDPSAGSVQPALRALMGERWLVERGL